MQFCVALNEVPLSPFYTLVTVITVSFYFIYKDKYSKKVKKYLASDVSSFLCTVTVISFKLITVTPMQKAYEKPVKSNEVALN